MLRIEKGFDESLFESSNGALRGYTDHHRMLLPAIAAYDYYNQQTAEDVRRKLARVMDGSSRTGTLALEKSNVRNAATNLGWLAIKGEIDAETAEANPWRVIMRDDEHAQHPGISVWAATRSLLKTPADAPDELSTRIRERYTFTASNRLGEGDIRAILVENEAPDDVMLATATVYAINKLVPKPKLQHESVDMSKFPALLEGLQRR